MGRKAAPQPLALQSDVALGRDDPPTAETTTTNTTINTTTTSSSQGLSPAASRSPRSPRSPFHSRFSPLRPQAKKGPPVVAASPASPASAKDEPAKHSPSDPSLVDEDAPSLYSSISSAIESQPTKAPQPTTTSNNTNTTTTTATTTATTTSTTSSSSPPPPPPPKLQQQPQPQPNPATTAQPSQHEPKKGTKNGFFHFSKPSKSFGHPPPHVHQLPRKDSEPRNQMMSRGNDGPGRPRHGGMQYIRHKP